MKLVSVIELLYLLSFHSVYTDGLKDDIERHSYETNKSQFQSRIVGGEAASPQSYSFMVSWHWVLELFPACGGSLVASNIVLTAAHCGKINGEVRIGSNYARERDANPDDERVATRRVKGKVPHPKYNPREFHYDYLLLELDEPVDTNVFKPIHLNFDDQQPREGDMLTVLGYGKTKEDGFHSEVLQEARIPAVSDKTCQSQYYYVNINEKVQFCAGFTNGRKDACQGDSGGPLLKQINGEPTQVGIISSGIGCAQPNFTGVYARISGVKTWLQTEICNRSSYPKPSWCYDIFPEAQFPTYEPTVSYFPTISPTLLPSIYPTQFPTNLPSGSTTITPTQAPSIYRTQHPTNLPSGSPTIIPTQASSIYPTQFQTNLISGSPTIIPTQTPSDQIENVIGSILQKLIPGSPPPSQEPIIGVGDFLQKLARGSLPPSTETATVPLASSLENDGTQTEDTIGNILQKIIQVAP